MSERVHQVNVIVTAVNGCQIVLQQQTIACSSDDESVKLAKKTAEEVGNRLAHLMAGTVVHQGPNGAVHSTGLNVFDVLQSIGIKSLSVGMSAMDAKSSELVVPKKSGIILA